MIITVSGMPGSGKSTLAKYLAKVLKYKYYGMGEIRRELALKKKLSINELNKIGEKNYYTDKYVDDFLKTLAHKDNVIVDGRMAFYFIPKSIKIFIKVDLKEGAKRIFKEYRKSENHTSIDETYEYLKGRMKSDDLRYRKYYQVHAFDIRNFDIILDTSRLSLSESEKTIKEALEKFINTEKINRS